VAVSQLLFLCVVAAIVLGLAERLFRPQRSGPREWPVYARPLLTEVEREFYTRLRAAIPQLLVLCQVQIGQFVELKDSSRRREIRNRYDRLTADFVVCGEDFKPLLVIELDDMSHDRPVQRARDAKKDTVLAAAGVAIVRFRGLASVERIREEVSNAIPSLREYAAVVRNVDGVRGEPYIGRL
jgi:very-short-patch-repair endonuclease